MVLYLFENNGGPDSYREVLEWDENDEHKLRDGETSHITVSNWLGGGYSYKMTWREFHYVRSNSTKLD